MGGHEKHRIQSPDAPWATHVAFDEFALDYDEALQQGLAVSGEDKDYFARGRLRWLAGCLRRIGVRPGKALDFGCGTGSSSRMLVDEVGADSVVGADPSGALIERANRQYAAANVAFVQVGGRAPTAEFDLAYCNGVFHHIPLDERATAVRYVFNALRPGGLFALWENNPWNPGTRLVMSRIPFDRDAILLSPPAARRMLSEGGFEVLHTQFHFIFPAALSWFRALEPPLANLPFGAQYQVLCRKPWGA